MGLVRFTCRQCLMNLILGRVDRTDDNARIRQKLRALRELGEPNEERKKEYDAIAHTLDHVPTTPMPLMT